MSQIEEEKELKIKVEYGLANLVYLPVPVPKTDGKKYSVKFVKDVRMVHRSGRKTGFLIPEAFKKLLLSKMKGSKKRTIIEFAMATYRYEKPREVFNIVYTIAIKHKSDNFRHSIGREMVTGRVKRYLRDKYKSYKAYDLETDSWIVKIDPNKKIPDFIHVEQEVFDELTSFKSGVS